MGNRSSVPSTGSTARVVISPLLVPLSFDAEPTKYLVAAVLRPGNASALTGTLGVLRRLVELVREYFPRVRLRLRADSAFAVPELLECLEAAGLEYVIGMPTNAVLARASGRSALVLHAPTTKPTLSNRLRRRPF
jgi:hypothetical protein